MFDLFTIAFAILILAGSVALLRRRNSLGERSKVSIGFALGFGLGGAVGLVLSRIAGTFVYILPVSLGIGMALAGGVGWALDTSRQSD